MAHPMPESGYCFEYTGTNWETSSSEEWDLVIHSCKNAKWVGTRRIDGFRHNVWMDGNIYYAQLER